ncbi:MAG TPA: YtxH domain-containing protein [Puia sp.]|nr:YtxH domain-containing protein [Puia sp.]
MSKTKTLFVFLTGMAAGTVAGILFAPHRGEKTRKKIAKRVKKIAGRVTDKAGEVGEQLKDGYGTAKDNLSKAFQNQ